MMDGESKKIVAILKDGELSISGIKEKLDRIGIQTHRLTLSGYLSAMVDLGHLKFKDIRPAKVYSINEGRVNNAYASIGRSIRNIFPEKNGDICLITLNYIFNRPIFIREIELCGTDLPINYRQANTGKKSEYMEKLAMMGINISETERTIEPSDMKDQDKIMKVLRDICISHYDLKFIIEELRDNDQKTLEDL